MCLILVGWRVHPQYPLVIAANRDEFFARPTSPADFWKDQPDLVAGRDLTGGGTWLGLTRTGRFAALTNHRDPAHNRERAPSRGQLVTGFLTGREYPQDAARALSADGMHSYNGFNLLLANRDEMFCFSNVTGASKRLNPGVYGLSNEFLDTPWPKVKQSKSALLTALDMLPDDAALFRLLRDDTVYPDHMLPKTGVAADWERLLSAAFVRGSIYGTRCSTVVLIDADGFTTFDEQTWGVGGKVGTRRRFRFRIC